MYILVSTVSLACLLQRIWADNYEYGFPKRLFTGSVGFDAGDKWRECQDLIYEVLDQSRCFSSWALTATGAMSDRICIHSNGTKIVSVSAEDLLSCCRTCGDVEFGHFGCLGGSSLKAWLYWNTTGIVTGGGYRTANGCKSYSLETCNIEYHTSHDSPPCNKLQKTPDCKKSCDESYDTRYEEDLTFGNVPYSVPNNERKIQQEIATNGPVEATFFAYEDFFEYRDGVYEQSYGQAHNYHSLKIIGWGIERDTPYWLCVGLLNKHWGQKGFIKFRRGINLCGIEGNIVAGMPLIA